MTNQNDSFIDEVTQELRRDRLAIAMRRYGWVVIALIVVMVAVAGWREFSGNRTSAGSQAFGDALIAAGTGAEPATALGQVATDGAPGRVGLAGLLQADAQLTAGDTAGATATLERVGNDAAVPPALRDLAQLKYLAVGGADIDPARRDALLSELSAEGAPYRLLALEQKAVALADAGRREEAVALIQQIEQMQSQDQITPNLQQRLGDLMTSLGAPQAGTDAAGQAAQVPIPPAQPAPAAAPAPAVPAPAPAN